MTDRITCNTCDGRGYVEEVPLVKAFEEPRAPDCEWTQMEAWSEENWIYGCGDGGESFRSDDEMPVWIKFCPFCGGRVRFVKADDVSEVNQPDCCRE